jgi:uncharacterized protein (TIGR00369 family)
MVSDVPVSETPASRLLGREVLAFDAEAGEARVRFLARPEFANRHGTVQGGLLGAMLDSACSMAVIAGLPAATTAVTTRLETTFVRPAPVGPMFAVARIAARDDRHVQVMAEIADETGLVLATGSADLRILQRPAGA